jgi:hypothetical protein
VQLVPGFVPIDREAVLHVVVSGGGAMLLAYAWFAWATGRASTAQVRGLAAAGLGFLISAAASIYLREHALVGPIVSLVGCGFVLAGMRRLLLDRLERQDAERRRVNGAPRE